MLTRYITSVTTAFSPFNPRSGKTARNFLALLPPNARKTMSIDIKVLPQSAAALPGKLELKFSTYKTCRDSAVDGNSGDGGSGDAAMC